MHNVPGDGNCGFRAVSYAVNQGDQTKWREVKDQMLEQYEKHKKTLYKAVCTDEKIAEYKEEETLYMLKAKRSPCLDDERMWLSSFSCTQVVADTYERPVMFYTYLNTKTARGEVREQKGAELYWPLINMDLANSNNPITILLTHGHFYCVELGRTPKGRMKKFNVPELNLDHIRLRTTYPEICNESDYSVLL